LGVARPPGYPFNLNSAVDALLKKELDTHRANGTQHPLAKAYGLDAIPLAHAKMDEWRNALSQGVMYFHEPTRIMVRGGVDDIWVNKNNELIVIDYKATSKDSRIESLDEEWHRGYKRQLEVYQWLLRKNGFSVSNTGYWFYANATKDRDAFDARLDFELTLVPHTGNADWVEGVLFEIKRCLEGDAVPESSQECDFCTYRKAVAHVLSKKSTPAPQAASKVEKTGERRKIDHEENHAQLF